MSHVTHRAVRRQESAAYTQKMILESARQLFSDRGYTATTVNDIAERAGVAVATVYTSVGGKPAILRALIMAGVEDPDSLQALAAVRATSEPTEVVSLIAASTRRSHETHRTAFALMGAGLNTTAAVADAVNEGIAGYRSTLRAAATRLKELSALKPRVTVERATEMLWFFFGLHSWPQLVEENGWSWADAERWLTDRATEALLSRG